MSPAVPIGWSADGAAEAFRYRCPLISGCSKRYAPCIRRHLTSICHTPSPPWLPPRRPRVTRWPLVTPPIADSDQPLPRHSIAGATTLATIAFAIHVRPASSMQCWERGRPARTAYAWNAGVPPAPLIRAPQEITHLPYQVRGKCCSSVFF